MFLNSNPVSCRRVELDTGHEGFVHMGVFNLDTVDLRPMQGVHCLLLKAG